MERVTRNSLAGDPRRCGPLSVSQAWPSHWSLTRNGKSLLATTPGSPGGNCCCQPDVLAPAVSPQQEKPSFFDLPVPSRPPASMRSVHPWPPAGRQLAPLARSTRNQLFDGSPAGQVTCPVELLWGQGPGNRKRALLEHAPSGRSAPHSVATKAAVARFSSTWRGPPFFPELNPATGLHQGQHHQGRTGGDANQGAGRGLIDRNRIEQWHRKKKKKIGAPGGCRIGPPAAIE